MSDEGLIAVFRNNVLVWTGNPIPAGFLRDGDTVHLGIGVFDASMFPPDLHLTIKGAGDGKDVDPGTMFTGKFLTGARGVSDRNVGLFTGAQQMTSEHWTVRRDRRQAQAFEDQNPDLL